MVVHRLLPIQPGITHSYDVVTTSQLDFAQNTMMPQNDIKEIEPNSRHSIVETKVSKVSIEENPFYSSHKITNNSNTFSIVQEDTVILSKVEPSKKLTDDAPPNVDNEDPGIQSLMEISLTSTASANNLDDCKYFL